MGRWAIYGAYGYSGEIAARRAVELGDSPVLIGRDRVRVAALGKELGLESRSVSVGDSAGLREALRDLSALLNCAGPFVNTAVPLLRACLASGTHYLDIGGEIDVLEAQASMHDEAFDAGLVVMPAVGFDVVPSDCLALHLMRRVPSASSLIVAFDANTGPSRGSVATGLRGLGGAVVRQDGALKEVPVGSKSIEVDFGFDRGRRRVWLVRWGDPVTAHFTTGLRNIETYAVVPKGNLRTLRWGRYLTWLLNTKPVSAALTKRLTGGVAGPSAEERGGTASWLYARVRDDAGHEAGARLRLPHVYTISAWTCVAAVQRVSGGEVAAGFTTPGSAFGAGFILSFEGVEIEDIY